MVAVSMVIVFLNILAMICMIMIIIIMHFYGNFAVTKRGAETLAHPCIRSWEVMLVPTTTTKLPSIAYLTRTWGMLSSESHLEVAWSVRERCEGYT